MHSFYIFAFENTMRGSDNIADLCIENLASKECIACH